MEEAQESRPKTDRIFNSALHLFAAFGYDGTTNGMIADAAGVSLEQIVEAGGRRGLYLAVLESYFQAQKEMLEEVKKDFTHDTKSVHNFLEHSMNFYMDNPYSAAVWQHRRLSDAADMKDLEKRFQEPIFRQAAEIVGPEILHDPDYEMMTMVVHWCIHGFVQNGIQQIGGPILTADDAEGRFKFRTYMHRLQDLLLQGGLMKSMISPDEPREKNSERSGSE